MQVRLNRCTEPEPGLYHAFTVTVNNELPRNRNAKVTDKRSKQLIEELCPSLSNKENNITRTCFPQAKQVLFQQSEQVYK